MNKITLADLIAFLPKTMTTVNEAFYSNKMKPYVTLVSSLLKHDKYMNYLKNKVITINEILYKNKADIVITFAPTTSPGLILRWFLKRDNNRECHIVSTSCI